MESALSAKASTLAVQQSSVKSLHCSAGASLPNPSLGGIIQTASAISHRIGWSATAEVAPFPASLEDPDSTLDFEGSEGASSIDRRGMTGPMRSVEIVGNELVAFGRTILTDVPERVSVLPCKHHDGPAAAETQGVFIGASLLDSSSRHVFTLGTLRGLRFLSCFRFKLWWMTQRVGMSGQEVPYETQFLLLERPPLSKHGVSTNPEDGGFRRNVSNQHVSDQDTVYVVLLPVLEGSFRSSLQGGFNDELEVCVESGDPSVTSIEALEAVYVHAGRNPFRTISEAVRAVEAHSGSFTRRELKTLPGLLDQFGWCTWDAFYTDVTAQGVNEGLESLAHGGTPAKFLIIDDGWQTVTNDTKEAKGTITAGTQYASRLTCVKENQKFKASSSFKGKTQGQSTEVNGHASAEVVMVERDGSATASTSCHETSNKDSLDLESVRQAAEEAAAASLAAEEQRLAGLGELVSQVKATHAVKFVYVWHALLGYWGGVTPGPQGGMEKFSPALSYPVPSHGVLANQPDMAEDTLTLNGVGVVTPAKAFHFYDELHSYLSSCGVDGVKVDVQNILETLGAGYGGRVAIAKEYHSALEKSIRKNFKDNGIISCMSHNTDALYLAKQTAVMRASDDFWPTDPASHTVHIISVAYNSLFLGEFMQPDWDMFQSLHPAAEFHGAARAAGGCAVYVSDKPGKHDFGVLRKLVLPDGSILRARLPGRPTKDCLFADPARDAKSLLKIWNINSCNGIVTAFNCQGAAWCREGRKYAVHNPQPGSVTGVVSAEDIDALADVAHSDWNGDVVVYSHFADELVSLPYHTNLVVSLGPLQCEVFTMSPIKFLGDIQFAPIGFGRMYNAGGALLATQYSEAGDATQTGEPVEGQNEGTSASATAKHRATLYLRGEGLFVAFSSVTPKIVLLNSESVAYSFMPEESRLTVEMAFCDRPVRLDIMW